MGRQDRSLSLGGESAVECVLRSAEERREEGGQKNNEEYIQNTTVGDTGNHNRKWDGRASLPGRCRSRRPVQAVGGCQDRQGSGWIIEVYLQSVAGSVGKAKGKTSFRLSRRGRSNHGTTVSANEPGNPRVPQILEWDSCDTSPWTRPPQIHPCETINIRLLLLTSKWSSCRTVLARGPSGCDSFRGCASGPEYHFLPPGQCDLLRLTLAILTIRGLGPLWTGENDPLAHLA